MVRIVVPFSSARYATNGFATSCWTNPAGVSPYSWAITALPETDDSDCIASRRDATSRRNSPITPLLMRLITSRLASKPSPGALKSDGNCGVSNQSSRATGLSMVMSSPFSSRPTYSDCTSKGNPPVILTPSSSFESPCASRSIS